jgi:hypothetical protein
VRHSDESRRHDAFEFIARAPPYVDEERQHADAFGQEPNEFFGRARAQRRMDHTGNAAPARKRHVYLPFQLMFSAADHSRRTFFEKS